MKTHYKDQIGYPVTNSVKHTVHVLKGNKVKAAIMLNDQSKLSINEIQDLESDILPEWWTSTQQPKKEFISPGQVTYVVDKASIEKLKCQGQQPQLLDINSVEAELKAANLKASPEALNGLHQNILQTIEKFSDIFQQYMNIERDDFVMRSWQIYAPKGALGRTPFLHIDHSVLTGMWYPYADRSPAQVCTGHVPEEVWRALQPKQRGKSRGAVSKKDHQNSMVLREFTKNIPPKDLMTLPDNALIVCKNLKNKEAKPTYRDLSDEKVRQSICLHKSGDVSITGQVGLIMIPQILVTN